MKFVTFVVEQISLANISFGKQEAGVNLRPLYLGLVLQRCKGEQKGEPLCQHLTCAQADQQVGHW